MSEPFATGEYIPSSKDVSPPEQPVSLEQPGEHVGPFKLLQRLGEGGMGAVWVAEQEQPVKRRVALKLIKPGMDSALVLRRFEAERQALAMMDHPNIAKVLDAGTTPAGRPYFAMELVKGVPITKYCDELHLTINERLALFVAVCQAIQHAHQKGIIHRDIKPSNVLVAVHDGKPMPKIIDFGVAKALNQRLTEQSMYTEIGAVIGTLEYMSPEQAELSALDIDTRTDIYSLGVLLYQLLTGTTPLDSKRIRSVPFVEMLRIVSQEEPTKPSTRLSESKESIANLASQRRTDPKKLTKAIRGELDWIVMKCLEKDRTRRYETASGLARDIDRHLADEPVEAGPPSATYRLRKLMRRHKGPVIAATLVITALTLGVIASTIGFATAKHNAWLADEASKKANEEAARATLEASNARKAKEEAQQEAYVASLTAANASLIAGELGGMRARLNACPESLRNWEWKYLDAKSDQSLRVFEIPDNNAALRIAYVSSNGDRAMTISSKLVVSIWDTRTGRQLCVLNQRAEGFTCAEFNHSGNRLVTAAQDKVARVWDVNTGKEVAALRGHQNVIGAASFNQPDNRIVTVSGDKSIRIWDAVTGQSLAVLQSKDNTTWATLNPSGDRAATITGGSFVLWDVAAAKEIVNRESPSLIGFARFSPSGDRILIVNYDKVAVVCDGTNGRELVQLKGHEANLSSGTFSPTGDRIVTSSDDGTARVWDAATGKELAVMRGHELDVTTADFNPAGDQVVTGSYDKTARVWDAATGKELGVFRGHTDSLNDVSFNSLGDLVITVSDDGTARVWDAAMGRDGPIIRGPDVSFMTADFDHAGERILTTSADGNARVWDVSTGKLITLIATPWMMIKCAAFSPDGKRVATGSYEQTDVKARFWDSVTGSVTNHLNVGSMIRAMQYSPSGTEIASACNDNTARIWDARNGKERLILKGHASLVQSVTFSPKGDRIATGSHDKTARIWDSATGKELIVFQEDAFISSVAFSPSGDRLVTASADKTARVWEVATGKQLALLRGHENDVNSAAFNSTGDRIVTASADKTARLWDPVTGKELAVLRGHQRSVESAQFSPSGDRIVTASEDKTVRVWHTAPYRDRFAAIAAARAAEKAMQTRLSGRLIPGADLERLTGEIAADASLDQLHQRAGLSLVAAERERIRLEMVEAQLKNQSAWEVVSKSDASAADVATALEHARRANALVPDTNDFCNTLGVALYRAGKYEEAIAALHKAEELYIKAKKGPQPLDWALLAMSQFKLGKTDDARASLSRLREMMKQPDYAKDEDIKWMLREAEALIEPKP